MFWLLYGCFICGQGVPHTSDASTFRCICVRVNECWGCWALSAVSAGMSVCLFVQEFPVSGDPTSVSGIFFLFLSALTNLPNRKKKTGKGETPTKWRIGLETWVRFCDPSLHKFWLLLKLNIVPGWERSLDGASSPAVSCFFCGVWGFLRWSLWQEWFEVFPAAHLIVLAKQKQLYVVVWERKWGAGEGESTLSQCWHQRLYLVKPQCTLVLWMMTAASYCWKGWKGRTRTSTPPGCLGRQGLSLVSVAVWLGAVSEVVGSWSMTNWKPQEHLLTFKNRGL